MAQPQRATRAATSAPRAAKSSLAKGTKCFTLSCVVREEKGEGYMAKTRASVNGEKHVSSERKDPMGGCRWLHRGLQMQKYRPACLSLPRQTLL